MREPLRVAAGRNRALPRSGSHLWLPYRPASSRVARCGNEVMTWVYFCGPSGSDAAGYGRQGCPPLQIGGGVRMRP